MLIRTGSIVTLVLVLSGTAYSADKAGSQSGALGSSWADTAKMPDLFTGMWMTFTAMVEADEKLNVPFTEAAQKYADAYVYKRDIPYAQEGCLPPGLPVSMRSGPLKFAYSPGLISIYQQGVGHTRFIRMNQEMGKTSPKYYGNSVGHFEGDTLVIETKDFVNEISFQYGVGKGLPPEEGFGPGGPGGGPPPGAGGPPGGGPGGAPPGAGGPPGGGPGGNRGLPPGVDGPPANLAQNLSKAIWGPHGEGMRMVERIRMVNPNTMELKMTIYDDTVWKQPYVAATRNYTRIQKGVREIGPFGGEPEEWICTVSITSFDPATNTYVDKDPEEMVEFLNKLGR